MELTKNLTLTMKKTVKTLALLFVSSLVMMSCGGVDADIERACEIQCEAEGLSGAELEKYMEDTKEEREELTKKYSKDGEESEEDQKAFNERKCECDDAE